MAKTIWSKDIKIIFVFALILRFILAPLFFHPDIKTQNFHFQFLSRGVLNIYQYIETNKQELPYRDTFNYLPLTYLSFGLGQIILKLFLPVDFTTWLNDWGRFQNNYPNLFYFMLVLKVPYIFFDLSIGYLLYRLFDKKTLLFWLFNPFSLYFIYVLANFDIVPVFFTLLAYYFLKKNSSLLSFLFLGIATALKLYPLLFFPFFIFYHPFKLKKVFVNTLIFLLPLLLTLLPFLSNSAFITAFSGSGLTQKILEFKIQNIPVYPLIYIIILSLYFFSKNKNLEKSILYLFLAFIIFVNFHAQWLLWFFPLFLPLIVKNKKYIITLSFILILALLYTFLTDDLYLFWGHLIPINYDFLNLTTPHQLLIQKFHQDPSLFQSRLKISFAFLSLIFIIFPHDPHHQISRH